MAAFQPKNILIILILILFSLISAVAINKYRINSKVSENQKSQDTLAQGSVSDEQTDVSKFSFEIIVSASPLAYPSPSFSPYINPSPLEAKIIPSFSPTFLPSTSPLASVPQIPIEEIAVIDPNLITDFNYFKNYNDASLGVSFKYHPEWVVAQNNDAQKLHFLDKNRVSLIQSRVFYAFEDPDYKLGQYEMLQVNLFNAQGKDLVAWLQSVNPNATANPEKLIYQKINNRLFLRIKGKENQVYLSFNGKIYSFWCYCADYSDCNSQSNENIFRKILETIN